ncbi:MAG: Minf_1886 family protein [Chthoniobacterales bacterium]
MQILGLEQAVELILEKDPRYRRDAYFFLRESLDFTMKRRRKNRKVVATTHVSAVELVEGFRDRALQEFGPMAITVLYYWGIKSSSDIGEMVFHLIEIGILGKTENDTRASFAHLLDFHQTFVLPFEPAQPAPPLLVAV